MNIMQTIMDMARDGTLQQSITRLRGTPERGYETVQGAPTEQVHPTAGARPQQSLGQRPVVTDPRRPMHPVASVNEIADPSLTQTGGPMMPTNPIMNMIQQLMASPQGQMMMASLSGQMPTQQGDGSDFLRMDRQGRVDNQQLFQDRLTAPGDNMIRQDIFSDIDQIEGGGYPEQIPDPNFQPGPGDVPANDRMNPQMREDSRPPIDDDDDEATVQMVSDEINGGAIGEYEQSLRLAIEEKDTEAIQQLLMEMGKFGIDPRQLPPDLVEQMNQLGAFEEQEVAPEDDVEMGDA